MRQRPDKLPIAIATLTLTEWENAEPINSQVSLALRKVYRKRRFDGIAVTRLDETCFSYSYSGVSRYSYAMSGNHIEEEYLFIDYAYENMIARTRIRLTASDGTPWVFEGRSITRIPSSPSKTLSRATHILVPLNHFIPQHRLLKPLLERVLKFRVAVKYFGP